MQTILEAFLREPEVNMLTANAHPQCTWHDCVICDKVSLGGVLLSAAHAVTTGSTFSARNLSLSRTLAVIWGG
jgi:hypothetical protein